MFKIIRRTREASNLQQWLMVTNAAVATRAIATVKEHVRKNYPQTKTGILFELHNGIGNDNNLFHGALLYALQHNLRQEATDFIRVVNVHKISEALAVGKPLNAPNPKVLDELCLLVSSKQARKITERYQNLPLPKTRSWLKKISLDTALPYRRAAENPLESANKTTAKTTFRI